MLGSYGRVLREPERYPPSHVLLVSTLLMDMGHDAEALTLNQYLEEHFRQDGNEIDRAGAMTNQAIARRRQGETRRALDLHREADRIFRAVGGRRTWPAAWSTSR